MKIGIITIFRANNYGAELQAFALQRKLELMGFDAEVINYPFYKNKEHVKSRLSKPVINIGLKNKLKEVVFPIVQSLREKPIKDALDIKRNKMEEFHRQNTRLSAKTYRCVEELMQEEWKYDLYITGSDQVWNPRLGSSIEPYFLSFAPENKPKISYASSFGVSLISADLHDLLKQRLSKYSKIAVREKQGVDIVKQVAGIDAVQVLDPTLLLTKDEWQSVSKPVEVPKPYILIYELMPCCLISEIALKLASENSGVNVVRIIGQLGIGSVAGVQDIDDAGPAEFIDLFAGASAVVTNSFHGTAFAVNFQKPVYPVIPAKMQNSSRITSLLEMLGMLDAVILEGKKNNLQSFSEFRYDEVTPQLLKARGESEAYLQSALCVS